jgi:hypothetical protein
MKSRVIKLVLLLEDFKQDPGNVTKIVLNIGGKGSNWAGRSSHIGWKAITWSGTIFIDFVPMSCSTFIQS